METASKLAPTPPTNNPRHWVARPLSSSRPKNSRPIQKVAKTIPALPRAVGKCYSQKCTPKQQSRQSYSHREQMAPFHPPHRGRKQRALLAISEGPPFHLLFSSPTSPGGNSSRRCRRNNTTATANATTIPHFTTRWRRSSFANLATLAEGFSVDIVSDILCSLKYYNRAYGC